MWRNCGEGPWDTELLAIRFAHAEVGMPYRARQTDDGWIVEVDDPDADNDPIEVCDCGHSELSDGYGGNDCPECGKPMRVLR